MLRKVTHCAGRISANTRPHQLCWGDREMGTAISCTECSQVAGLIHNLVETSRKHCLFVHTEVLEVPEVLMANKAQGKQCKANSACKGVCV